MPGQSASEDARERAYDPGIHRKKRFKRRGWIAGSSPAMTDATWAPTLSLLNCLQHRRSRLHFGEARGALLERELVAAPQFHIPVLVDMRRRPGRVDRQPTAREGDRKQRRAGQRRDRVGGAELPWVAGDAAACGCERLRGLSDEGDSLRQYEVRA